MARNEQYHALRKRIRQFEYDTLVQQRVAATLLDDPGRFKSFMQDAPFSIEIYTPDGVQREVNEGWKNLYYLHPRESIDKFNALHDPQAVSLGSRQNFERVLAGESFRLPDYDFDPALSGFVGRRRRVRPVFYPLKKGQTVTNVVITYEDITARRQTEEELVTHIGHLEEFVKALTLELSDANSKVRKEIAQRLHAEKENKLLFDELKKALAAVAAGTDILPICSSCKKIVDDRGSWHQIEDHLRKHFGINFTHGICPDCIKILYSDLDMGD